MGWNTQIGKILIIIGAAIALVGLGMVLFGRLKIPFLGRLPGDIFIKTDKFTFYFPLATCLLISGIISLLIYLFSKLHK